VPYPDSDKTAPAEAVVSWLVLVLSGVLEAVWATALGRSEGFSRLVPSVVFGVALVLSMVGAGLRDARAAVGTAYAVWVGHRRGADRRHRHGDGEEPCPR
jgi:quaternary ammonium compound-resistance protein SugE